MRSGIERCRHHPAEIAEPRPQRGGRIAVRLQAGVGPYEEARQPSRRRLVEPGQPPRQRHYRKRAAQPARHLGVFEEIGGSAIAQRPQELPFRSERRLPHRRMYAVGAHQQVRRHDLSVAQRRLRSRVILRHRGDARADAAYAVSLVAGQGASMALAGGTLLGELLTPDTAIEPALRAMEAQLRPAVLQKQRSGRRTARWFVPATQLHIVLRNLAFRAMNTRLLSGLLSQVFSLDSKGFTVGGGRS